MGSQTTEYIDALLQYLVDESKEKNGPCINREEWNLVRCDVAATPKQTNDYDCGVFITMFADFILDDIPLVYFDQSHISLFRQKMSLHITKGEFSY